MAGRGVDIILGGNAELLAQHELAADGVDLESDEGLALLDGREKEVEARCRAEGEEVRKLGGLYVLGSRAPRVAAHRQPAPWPLRPPGRPRRVPLLPVVGRRAVAAVRHRRHVVGDGPHAARRRADRVEDGRQGDRTGAEHRRGPQRRDAQGRAQVRRGHGPAAQGHLRAAPADHRRRRPRGAHRGPARRRRREARGRALPDRVRGGLGPQGPRRRDHAVLPDEVHRRGPGAGGDDRGPRRVHRRGGPRLLRAARRGHARRRGDDAPDRARRVPPDHGRPLARPPLRDGQPQGRHPPALDRPGRPPQRLAAGGLQHVRPAARGHRQRLPALHPPCRSRAAGRLGRAGPGQGGVRRRRGPRGRDLFLGRRAGSRARRAGRHAVHAALAGRGDGRSGGPGRRGRRRVR